MMFSVISGFNITAFAEDALTGELGKNITYTYDIKTDTLTLTGTGEMYDYRMKPFQESTKHLIVGKGITRIGKQSFFKYVNLETISLPEGLLTIDEYAFSECAALKEAYIPITVKVIAKGAFERCTSLEKTNIPYGITEIANLTYYDCNKLQSVEIPNTVKKIGAQSLSCCSGIKNLIIPDSVTEIQSNAFRYCSNLENLTLSENITKINSGIIEYCHSLTDLIIPKNVTEIASGAINSCNKLKKIYIMNPDCNIYYPADGLLYAKGISVPGVTLISFKNSAVQEYAEKEKIAFVPFCTDGTDNHHYEAVAAKKATLTNDGIIQNKCINCDNIVSTSVLPSISEVKLNRNIFTTNSHSQIPSISYVKDSKGESLQLNKDYTVVYSDINSKNVGRYTVTVKFIGNYSGEVTYPYYINPVGTSFLSSSQGGFKAIENGFILTWNKQASQTTGYQLQYATKSDFSNAASVWIDNPNITTATVTGKAANTRYYVRIRTYTNIGTGTFYSDWDYVNSYVKSIVTLNGSTGETGKWIKSGNRWWYRHADGSYTTNDWEKINGKWYHFDSAGWMQTGWLKTGGKWYYLNASGDMLTGWQYINGAWYYMNSSGAMLTGWQKIGGDWYYMNSSGAMCSNQWIGNYYVNSSGRWVKTR